MPRGVGYGRPLLPRPRGLGAAAGPFGDAGSEDMVAARNSALLAAGLRLIEAASGGEGVAGFGGALQEGLGAFQGTLAGRHQLGRERRDEQRQERRLGVEERHVRVREDESKFARGEAAKEGEERARQEREVAEALVRVDGLLEQEIGNARSQFPNDPYINSLITRAEMARSTQDVGAMQSVVKEVGAYMLSRQEGEDARIVSVPGGLARVRGGDVERFIESPFREGPKPESREELPVLSFKEWAKLQEGNATYFTKDAENNLTVPRPNIAQSMTQDYHAYLAQVGRLPAPNATGPGAEGDLSAEINQAMDDGFSEAQIIQQLQEDMGISRSEAENLVRRAVGLGARPVFRGSGSTSKAAGGASSNF